MSTALIKARHPALAGVQLRPLVTHGDRLQAVALQEATWGRGFSERVPAALLLVAEKTGGVAGGAFTPDGSLVGFVFGLAGLRDGRPIHWSDMLAVTPAFRRTGLAEELKHWQADRCRALGVATMYWTFDPLVARNAWFNLRTLGARVDEFAEDLYGVTDSVLMGRLPTDRFVAAWDLDRRPPRPRDDAPAHIPLPADFEHLVTADPAAAGAARLAFRHALRQHLTQGRRIVGITRRAGATSYLLDVE